MVIKMSYLNQQILKFNYDQNFKDDDLVTSLIGYLLDLSSGLNT